MVEAKKRKHSTNSQGAVKKTKLEQSKDKGKVKDTPFTEFQVVKASLVVSIPPVFARDSRAGVEEMLDGMLMRYIPNLRGVVLSHSNLIFSGKTATVQGDCPFLVCTVTFDATIWSPAVGMRLVGKINLSSPDHISLLLHRTFNVSIPRHHIPIEHWEFEYGAAENDPEFGAVTEGEQGSNDGGNGDGGRWVHRLSADALGGPDGFLEFTVIGFTIANEMLSLLGSIQPDPFSPLHQPQSGLNSKASNTDSDSQGDQEVGGGSEEEDEDGETSEVKEFTRRNGVEVKRTAEAPAVVERTRRKGDTSS